MSTEKRLPLPQVRPQQLSESELEELVKALPPGIGPKEKVWTEAMDKMLLTYWHKVNKQELAKLLGVSTGTARTRWKMLMKEGGE
jgi:hypothetical protein